MANYQNIKKLYGEVSRLGNENKRQEILKIYRSILDDIEGGNSDKSIQKIQILKHALDHSFYPEFSMGLSSLYDFCVKSIEEGEAELAYNLINDLYSCWRHAIIEDERAK